MHAALGDHLAVEVGELLEEPHVLQQLRAACAGRQHVLVVGHWAAECGGEFLLMSDSLVTASEASR